MALHLLHGSFHITISRAENLAHRNFFTKASSSSRRNHHLGSFSSSAPLRIVAKAQADQAAASRVERLRQEFLSDPSQSSDNGKLDKEWQEQRREESKELERLRQLEDEEEEARIDEYRQIGTLSKNIPEEDITQAKQLVSSLIKSGEDVEERIIEAAENDELTETVLLTIQNRLELARYDGERDVVQALDLLFRRVEMEIMKRRSSIAAQFLNELLNLHDGFSHTEWINRCRKCMLEVFPCEDAFTILAPSGIDLSSHMGPIDMPADEDDTLLKIDFIREIDKILADIEAQPRSKTVEGLDAQSVSIRLQQQQRDIALQQIKDLRNLAVILRW